MKKLNKIIGIGFLTIGIVIGVTLEMTAFDKATRVKADSDVISPKTLGVFYTYERVSVNTKIIIPASMIDFVEEAGRTVEVEYINGGLDPIPWNPPIPMGGG